MKGVDFVIVAGQLLVFGAPNWRGTHDPGKGSRPNCSSRRTATLGGKEVTLWIYTAGIIIPRLDTLHEVWSPRDWVVGFHRHHIAHAPTALQYDLDTLTVNQTCLTTTIKESKFKQYRA